MFTVSKSGASKFRVDVGPMEVLTPWWFSVGLLLFPVTPFTTHFQAKALQISLSKFMLVLPFFWLDWEKNALFTHLDISKSEGFLHLNPDRQIYRSDGIQSRASIPGQGDTSCWRKKMFKEKFMTSPGDVHIFLSKGWRDTSWCSHKVNLLEKYTQIVDCWDLKSLIWTSHWPWWVHQVVFSIDVLARNWMHSIEMILIPLLMFRGIVTLLIGLTKCLLSAPKKGLQEIIME